MAGCTENFWQELMGEKNTNDGFKTSVGKSQARFQILQVSSSATRLE